MRHFLRFSNTVPGACIKISAYYDFLMFFQSLDTSEFPEIVPQLRPLMHTVCLVYSHSTFYNSPARIIVLMTETCNLLIGMGRKFLDPTSLFQVTIFVPLLRTLYTIACQITVKTETSFLLVLNQTMNGYQTN